MRERDNKCFWQRFARLYGPVMKSSRGVYEEVSRRMEPYLSQNMNVLELACGSGQLSFLLAKRVHLWEATDFSEAMIEEAKKRGRPRSLHFSVQDATCLPYASGSFDAVVISNGLHIMPHPETALTEISRVLKPGGLLLAPTFVRKEGKGPGLRIHMMELMGFRTFYKWDKAGFIAYLEEHGFGMMEQELLEGGMAPLCFAAARTAASGHV